MSDDVNPANLGIYERSKLFLSKREQELKKKQEDAARKETEEATFKPMITELAKSKKTKKDIFEYNSSWKEKINKQLQAKREEQLKSEQAIINAKPKVSPHSKAILEQSKKGHAGPISAWDKHFDEYKKRKEPKPDEFDHIPKINDISTAIVRPGTSWERLYQEAKDRKRREQNEQDEAERQQLTDQITGQQLFKPVLSPKSIVLASNHAHGNNNNTEDSAVEAAKQRRSAEEFVQYLLAKGKEIENKKKELREKQSAGHTFMPKTNAISPELEAKLKTERKPLYSPKIYIPRNMSNQNSPVQEAKQSPREQKISPAVMKDFLKRNVVNIKEKEKKLMMLKMIREREELKDCTFQPKIDNNSKKIFSNSSFARRTSDDDRFSDTRSSMADANSVYDNNNSSGDAAASGSTAATTTRFDPESVAARYGIDIADAMSVIQQHYQDQQQQQQMQSTTTTTTTMASPSGGGTSMSPRSIHLRNAEIDNDIKALYDEFCHEFDQQDSYEDEDAVVRRHNNSSTSRDADSSRGVVLLDDIFEVVEDEVREELEEVERFLSRHGVSLSVDSRAGEINFRTASGKDYKNIDDFLSDLSTPTNASNNNSPGQHLSSPMMTPLQAERARLRTSRRPLDLEYYDLDNDDDKILFRGIRSPHHHRAAIMGGEANEIASPSRTTLGGGDSNNGLHSSSIHQQQRQPYGDSDSIINDEEQEQKEEEEQEQGYVTSFEHEMRTLLEDWKKGLDDLVDNLDA